MNETTLESPVSQGCASCLEGIGPKHLWMLNEDYLIMVPSNSNHEMLLSIFACVLTVTSLLSDLRFMTLSLFKIALLPLLA